MSADGTTAPAAGKRTDVTVPADVPALIAEGARVSRCSKFEFQRRAIVRLVGSLANEAEPLASASEERCPTCGQAVHHRRDGNTVRVTIYADADIFEALRWVADTHFRGVMSHAFEAGVRLLSQEVGVGG